MTLTSLTFNYTTCSAVEKALEAGIYTFEVWGASGGGYKAKGGCGGYSKGTITLKKKTTIFVNVGSKGLGLDNSDGGCNGGGTSKENAGSGGGATDIRLNTNSLYARVIVAGGGGGSGDGKTEIGGFGGGLVAGNGENDLYRAGKGGEQEGETVLCADGINTSCIPGTFGYGASPNGQKAGGAGGGWYGGSASYQEEGSGGGSGYIFTKNSFKPPGFQLTEDYYLENAFTRGGNETLYEGDGYAVITPLEIFPIQEQHYKTYRPRTLIPRSILLTFTLSY